MRQKMLDHRVRADCIQCHSMMDPIGFSLENFDGIASWRTQDEGQPVDASAQVFDGTKIDGPVGLRTWLLGYSDQFVQVVAEKLLRTRSVAASSIRHCSSGRSPAMPRVTKIVSRRWFSASSGASLFR